MGTGTCTSTRGHKNASPTPKLSVHTRPKVTAAHSRAVCRRCADARQRHVPVRPGPDSAGAVRPGRARLAVGLADLVLIRALGAGHGLGVVATALVPN